MFPYMYELLKVTLFLRIRTANFPYRLTTLLLSRLNEMKIFNRNCYVVVFEFVRYDIQTKSFKHASCSYTSSKKGNISLLSVLHQD